MSYKPFKPVKADKECRTKRAELLLTPSLHKNLKDIAEAYCISFNELVNQVLNHFVEGEKQ